jgi:hypothetical protein
MGNILGLRTQRCRARHRRQRNSGNDRIGSFAIAAAPALARHVGGTVEDANRFTEEMYGVTIREHPQFTIPTFGFRVTPLGIDARRILILAVEPRFNTGIAHRTAGVGQFRATYGMTYWYFSHEISRGWRPRIRGDPSALQSPLDFAGLHLVKRHQRIVDDCIRIIVRMQH